MGDLTYFLMLPLPSKETNPVVVRKNWSIVVYGLKSLDYLQ